MGEWHENEQLWVDLGPVMFTPQRRAQAPSEVDKICKLVDLPRVVEVLDVGCGVGRHSVAFAKRGHKVTGIDAVGPYLDEAIAQAATHEIPVEFLKADMRAFRREDSFDLVVNLLTAFGYFADPADDRRVVENMVASMRSCGAIVIDLMPREVLARIFRERDWSEHEDGTILLEERTLRDDWTMLDVRWIVFRGAERLTHAFSLRLYTADQLLSLFRAAGCADVRAYGSLDGAPYDHKAERLVVVARKPSSATA